MKDYDPDHGLKNVGDKPNPEELFEGKAFGIRYYDLDQSRFALAGDRFVASIMEGGRNVATIAEPITQEMEIDTIATVRFNDALGFKNAIGAYFGKRDPEHQRNYPAHNVEGSKYEQASESVYATPTYVAQQPKDFYSESAAEMLLAERERSRKNEVIGYWIIAIVFLLFIGGLLL